MQTILTIYVLTHYRAFTEKICERRGRIYGTAGEISYDSSTISVFNFLTGQTKVYSPHIAEGGHGGGDEGLARQFLMAVNAVNKGMGVGAAQREFLGCDLDEAFRSHAVVFAAEEARRERYVQLRESLLAVEHTFPDKALITPFTLQDDPDSLTLL
jgi:hypothetical protein